MYVGHRLTLFLLCACFLAEGIVIASIGPSLPDLARQVHKPLAELGILFAPLFGGAIIAQLIAGPFSDRFGRRVVLVSSLIMFALGMVTLTLCQHFGWMLTATAFAGLGFGGLTLVVNVLAAELAPERSASTLNLVNGFYAIGAIAGPLLAGLALSRYDRAVPAIWSGATMMILFSPLATRVPLPALAHRQPRGAASTAVASAVSSTATAVAAAPPTLRSWFLWACAAVLLIYVGSEASVGSWTTVYLMESTGATAVRAAALTSVFWVALCVGRAGGVVAGLHLTAQHLLLLSLAGTVLGGVALVGGHGVVGLTLVGLAILGMAYGPVYPTMMAIVAGRYAHAAATAASRVGAVASIGGMLLPSVHGRVIEHAGTRASALLILGLAVLMCIGWLLILRLDRRDAASTHGIA